MKILAFARNEKPPHHSSDILTTYTTNTCTNTEYVMNIQIIDLLKLTNDCDDL